MTSKTIQVSIIENGNMCAIPVPFDPKVVFGKVRAAVKVTINGYTFRSTIARMGGETFIPLRKSHRQAAKVESGNKVRVKIESDTEERSVQVPSDLEKKLKKSNSLWNKWNKLSYTNRKECVESVASAKKAATRERRIAKVISFVRGK